MCRVLGTGIFQPADVGLQRIIKHRIRQAQLLSLVKNHFDQVGTGLSADQVRFTTSLPVLRDASVSHIVDAWEFLNGPDGRDIIRKVCHVCSVMATHRFTRAQAWEKCSAKEWNLSEDMITSRKATAALRKYLATDEVLRKEIEGKVGPLPGPGALEDEPQISGYEEQDDSDVPSSSVIWDALGLDVPSADDCGRYCVRRDDVASKEQTAHLHAMGSSEDVWAHDDDALAFEGSVEGSDDE